MPEIFRDSFTTTISASWAKSDTANKLSVVSGRLYANGGQGSPVWNDPGLRYPSGSTLTRATLGGVAALVRFTNLGGAGPALGLQPVTNPTNPAVNGSGLYFDYPDLRTAGGDLINPSNLRMRSIDYLFTVIARAGAGYLVAVSVPTGSTGGPYPIFPLARLVWVEDSGSDAALYAHLGNRDGTWFSDHASIIDSSDLTTALSTKFGAATAADEWNRANATLSGSTNVGAKTYSFPSPLAAPVISSNALSCVDGTGFMINAGTPGTAAHMIEVSLTTPSGARGIEIFFRGDGGTTNVLGAYFESGECGVWNYAALGPDGSPTAQTTAVTLPASTFCRLRVVDYGTGYRVFLNDTDVFNGLIASTTFNTGTYCGVRVYNATQVIDDFAVWPSQVTLPTSLGPLPAVPVGTGSALQSYTFTASNGTSLPSYNAAWTVRSGTWNIQSNKARMTTASVNGTVTVGTGTAGANHEIRADITLPNTTPDYSLGLDWFAGLTARWTDANNYLKARFLYQNNSPEVELWERVGGAESILVAINLGPAVLAPGSTHNLRLAVLGNQVSTWCDGEIVSQATTTLLSGGNAGLMVADSGPNGQPDWDNVEVRATGAVDTNPPVITAGPTAGSTTTTAATITWTTDELADSQVEYGTTSAYGSSTSITDSSGVTSHSVNLSGLPSNTVIHYRVKSKDLAGNGPTNSGDTTFTTLSAAGAAPVITAGPTTSSVTSGGFAVNWTTDIASDSQVEYGTTGTYGSSTTLDPTPVTSHSVVVGPGLTANQVYHYRVKSSA